jgi:hypothetical protein
VDWSAIVVWGTLAALVAVALRNIARFGRNIPLAEDWTVVPALTGHQHGFWGWLWSQNNEHRLPLPRLVYLGLLHITHDFRVGMVFNVVVLTLVAALFVLASRRARGRSSIVDAFFPIVLLNLGNWENMFWGWQMQFVLATSLVLLILAVVVAARVPLTPRATLVAAGPIVLLPLVGGSALPMVPASLAALWFLCPPLREGRSRRILIALGGTALVLVGLYFIGWVRPSWYPDNPGPRPTAKTTAKLLAMGWGPAADWSWSLAVVGMAAVLGSAALLIVLAVRRGGPDRPRALALGCFFGGCLVVSLAVGYGRAALVPTQGFPDRYALLAVPGFFASWFAWQLCGPAEVRRVVHGVLLAAVVLILPLNVRAGHEWRDWYRHGMRSVESDIRDGRSAEEIAARHSDFLMHWDQEQLARDIEMLRAQHVGPFADVPEAD